MNRALLAASAALVMGGCPPPPPRIPRHPPYIPEVARADRSAGSWRAAGFSPAAEGCTQTWACDCSAFPVSAGCRVVPEPDATTSGVCAANRGALNGCARCLALEPASACACGTACP